MQQSQKILLVITKSNWGGAQRYVYDLATSLAGKHFDVLVALGGEGSLKVKLQEAGINTVSIPGLGRDVNIFGDVKVAYFLFRLFWKEHYDVVHLNSSKIGGLGSLAARLAGIKKIVFTIHGWAFNEDRGFISKTAIKFFYWLTLLFSHKAIAVSESVRRQGSHFWISRSKIITIHNGIDIFSAIMEKAAAKDRLGITSDKTLVGTIGELHPIKGQRYAIEASSSNEKFSLYIIGEGDERKALEQQLSKADIKNVFLLGHKDNSSSYLKAFDIFLLSSLSEGLAYVLLEAGLASLPVIATNVGGIPEIIENMHTGLLIPPKDPEAIRTAIDFYLSNPDKAKEYGDKLHNKVVAEFSLQTMVEKTIDVYEI